MFWLLQNVLKVRLGFVLLLFFIYLVVKCETFDRIGQVFGKCFKEAVKSCDGQEESSHLYWVSEAMVQPGVLES